MKLRLLVVIASLFHIGFTECGWHTRVINKTKWPITFCQDLMMQMIPRKSFHTIGANETLDIDRGYMCLNSVTLWTGSMEILRRTRQILEQAGLTQQGGFVSQLVGGKIEEWIRDFLDLEEITVSIPLMSNRCQHWDFILTEQDGRIEIEKEGHIFVGSPEFHPELYEIIGAN